jgi:hypothetical protein
MYLSIYIKGDYEEFLGLGRRKNKANSPTFGRKSEILSPKSEKTNMCGMTDQLAVW